MLNVKSFLASTTVTSSITTDEGTVPLQSIAVTKVTSCTLSQRDNQDTRKTGNVGATKNGLRKSTIAKVSLYFITILVGLIGVKRSGFAVVLFPCHQ